MNVITGGEIYANNRNKCYKTAGYQGVTVFTEQEWNNLVERIVVKPDSLDFEFKNGEKIKITI